VRAALDAGLAIDDFAPRVSFFFACHMNFFEEVAKFRAARRLWARIVSDRFEPVDPRSAMLRFHTQTGGATLTAQQPENNIVRTALEALAAVLGGTQSLHTNALDEVLALPTEKAAQIALRTQQIIAYETGAGNVIDPLGGSYFVEALTDRMEQAAEEYFAKIKEMGQGSLLEGMLAGIERGYFQSEIADAAYREQELYEKGRLVKVGVNDFVDPHDKPIDVLLIHPETEERQIDRVRRVRSERDGTRAGTALKTLKAAAATDENLVPLLVDCARAYCTEGERIGALKEVFGEYTETPRF